MSVRPESSSGASVRATLWPRALLCCLAVALCYANSLRVPFLLDDPQPDVRISYSSRPLVGASFALNRALSGAETWSFHVFNALVHLACGFLLTGILRRTLASVAPLLRAGTRDNLAFVTTLLWLCHPLQTESVTYLSQRAESMGAFFYLAVLYSFLRSAAAARPLGWQALALLSLALGFATKESVATAPISLLLYDSVFLVPGPVAAVRRRPGFYAALALVTLALALVFVVPLLLAENITAGFRLLEFGPREYARTQPGVVLHYLRLVFWPHPLCFDYGWPVATTPREYLPQSAAIAVLLAGSLVLLARRSWIGFAATSFFLVLAPTSSFVPIRDLAFEHRVYLPLAAVLVLVVVGAWWLCTRFLGEASRLPSVLAGAAVVALVFMTLRRNQDYGSAVKLMQVTVEQAPRNARAHANLGAMLLEAGRTEEGIAELFIALGLDPHAHAPYLNLGSAYLRLGDPDRAIPLFERAVESRAGAPEEPRCRELLGRALLVKGDDARAIDQFQEACRLDPLAADLRCWLAKTLARSGRREEAIQQFQETLRLDPDLQDARHGLAALLAEQGKPNEALEHSLRALEIAPNSAEEHFNLAQALRSLGRFDEAMAAFLEASRLAPELPEPYSGFARTVCMKPDASLDERREALRLASKANEMTHSTRPDFLEVCAMAQAALGDFESAAALVEQALALPGPARNEVFASRLRAQRADYLEKAGR